MSALPSQPATSPVAKRRRPRGYRSSDWADWEREELRQFVVDFAARTGRSWSAIGAAIKRFEVDVLNEQRPVEPWVTKRTIHRLR